MSDTTATPMPTAPTPSPSQRYGSLTEPVFEWPRWRRDDVRRWLAAVPNGIALALFFIYGVLVPAYVAFFLTDTAFNSGALALEVLVVVVLMAVTVRLIWWSVGAGFSSLLRFGRFQPALRASAVAGFAAMSFTSLTGLLYQEGLVGISPAPPQDRVFDVSLDFYLWHIANTLPLVDIPGNLGWEKPFEFDSALGGLLVIGFTGLVIFPLIQLARVILAGGGAPFDVKVVRALGEHVGDRRIRIETDPEGYARATIDDWVVIDVIPDVRNHDAPVQRLEWLGDQPFVRRARGYLLVVDAIAEGARERVEHPSRRLPSRPRSPSGAAISVPRT